LKFKIKQKSVDKLSKKFIDNKAKLSKKLSPIRFDLNYLLRHLAQTSHINNK
jgi:hypothetical protein